MTDDLSVAATSPAIAAARKKIPIVPISFAYTGLAGRLSSLWYSILLMRALTFGLYAPWGKTRIRQFVSQQFYVGDTSFVYTGTGRELFIGMLKAVFILGPLFALMQYLLAKQNPLAALCMLAFALILYIARYSALRYRLSRLTLMGIRFSLRGSSFEYLGLRIKWLFINIFTLGYTIPYADMEIRQYILTKIRFGDFAVYFRPQPKALMRIHLVTLLLSIPTIGLSRMWYRAELYRLSAKCMRIGQGVFIRTDVKGAELCTLYFTNFLIALLSLGLLTPYVLHRKYVFLGKHITIMRRTDIDDSASQAPEPPTTQTEGLDAMLGDTGLAF